MASENYTAQKKYDQKYAKGVYLKLNIKTDIDILEHLEKQDSKQGYIKELIRADIERKN